MRDSGGQLVLHFDRLDGDRVSRRAHRHILRRSSCTTRNPRGARRVPHARTGGFPADASAFDRAPALPAARGRNVRFRARRGSRHSPRNRAGGRLRRGTTPRPARASSVFVLFRERGCSLPRRRRRRRARLLRRLRGGGSNRRHRLPRARAKRRLRRARVSPPPPRVSPSPEAISTSRARREIRAVTIQIPRAFEVRPSRGRPPRRDRSAPPCLTRTRIARKSVQSHRPRRSRASRSR